MLQAGVVSPSNSPWAFPVVMVRKKGGALRFCVDFRKLNALTVRDQYPLPRIDDTLQRLGGAQWFSALDLAAGYWQIPLAPDSRAKTAFRTVHGLYEFNVLPFGLCNAPSTFQRLMDISLSGLKWDCCMCYIDDILIFSRTFEEHLRHIDAVLTRLETVGLHLKCPKCHFCLPAIHFLGHVVTKDGVLPDEDHVKAIKEYPQPRTTAEVYRFFGMAGYYRDFVPEFATISAPLLQIIKEKRAGSFQLSAEELHAFNAMREKLMSAPILACPDFTLPFHIDCDASSAAVGAVLYQMHTDCIERTVAYISHALSRTERAYSNTEREAFAIVYSVSKWKHMLTLLPFVVHTDHRALLYLYGKHSKHSVQSNRVCRWQVELAMFDFTLIARTGKSNVRADALSRVSLSSSEIGAGPECPDEQPAGMQAAVTAVTSAAIESIMAGLTIPQREFALAQRRDAELAPLIAYLEEGTLPEDMAAAKNVLCQVERYTVMDSMLYLLPWTASRRTNKRQNGSFAGETLRLVVPACYRSQILAELHDSPMDGGHLGTDKVYGKLLQRFYWRGMFADVALWVASCQICQRHKGAFPKAAGLLVPLPIDEPFMAIAIDIIGPLRQTARGKMHIVVLSDYFTKWVEDRGFAFRGCRHDCTRSD